jgi:ABC-type Fe3+ transport system substrate-binding protein
MLVRHVSSAELLAARGKDEEAVDSPGDMFVLDGADDFAKKQVTHSVMKYNISRYLPQAQHSMLLIAA